MAKFFTPQPWEKEHKIIHFKNNNITTAKTKTKNQKKNKKLKKNKTAIEDVKVTFVPSKLISKSKKSPKVKGTVASSVSNDSFNNTSNKEEKNKINKIHEKDKKDKKLAKATKKAKSPSLKLSNGGTDKVKNKLLAKKVNKNEKKIISTKATPNPINKSKKKKCINKSTKTIEENNSTQIKSKKSNDKSNRNDNKSENLLKKLKSRLLGGRFRYLNEQLYSNDSNVAVKLFKDDPNAFFDYHQGYRQQVEKWPMNPLNRIIKMVKRLPKTLEIGDFGCGDGQLALSVPNIVHSFDLVSQRSDIVTCDIAHTPLRNESIDIAVYCLSLMGTNLRDYISEAHRTLKLNGLVFIAEIKSRFENVQKFVKGIESCGFELIRKDTTDEMFLYFQFKKIQIIPKAPATFNFNLKPCVYRKR